MKRLFVLLLSGIIISSSIPMHSFASMSTADAKVDVKVDARVDAKASTIAAIREEYPMGSKTQPTQTALQAAIKVVKSKITIPKEYSEFNYYFNDANSYSEAYWTMTWSKPDGNAYIQVTCDEDYHITHFSKYDYSKTEAGIATYLKSELKTKADEFIRKVAPETVGRTEYINADYEGSYSGNYVYNYQRKNNGVDFPDNTVKVSINSNTGEVTSISVNWLYDGKVPSAKATISKEEATKLIKENMKMKLVYRSDYYRIYDSKIGVEPKRAYLVYEPTLSYISVDAKTGKVYLTRSEWINTRAKMDKAAEETMAVDSAAGSVANELTEAEIARIEELKDLISKDKAIDIVTGNSSLYIDKNLKSYSASLNKLENSKGKTSYVWYVNLNDPREVNYEKDTDYYRAYASATVDAQTGKILSFYANTKSYYNEKEKTWNTVKIPYDKEEARVILEKFLKKQMSSRFANTVLSNENDDYVIYYKNDQPVYGGYHYQYNRVNDAIEYPNNSVYGSVDGVTGKIYSFGSNWDEDIVFESPKGAIAADEAMNYYLGNDSYDLKYEINQINKIASTKNITEFYDYSELTSVEHEVRLVYRPDVSPAYISPFTGEQMDYQGKIYKDKEPYTYSDIKDAVRYRDVLLLADMNIGFEGEKFLPDQAITVSEINDLLSNIGYGYYIEAATTTKDTSLITREKIAYTFITKLGLEKMSKLQGIYKTDYIDETMIDTQYLGSVALAKGLGLIDAEAENKFNPKNNVSRFDAVSLIMNFIEVQKSGVY